MKILLSLLSLLLTWSVYGAQQWVFEDLLLANALMKESGIALPILTTWWANFAGMYGPLIVAVVGTVVIAIIARRENAAPFAVYNAVIAIYGVLSLLASTMPFMHLVVSFRR